MEAALHQSVNRFRSEQHLIALTRDPALDAVARAHSEDMAARRFFSHQSPEGHNWVDRLQRFGIEGFSMAGENVGMTSRSNPNQEILHGWLNSPAHRENLTARPFNGHRDRHRTRPGRHLLLHPALPELPPRMTV